jgi:HlyD family secretion protein
MKLRLIWLALAMLAVGGGAAWLSTGHHGHADFTFATVEKGSLAETVNATGTVRPRETYPVCAEIPGRVVSIAVEFNQEVSEGDVLLCLDDRATQDQVKNAELAVDAASVQLRQAEAARDTSEQAVRRERDRDPEIRSNTEKDAVTAQFRSAELGVDAARVRLRQAEEGLTQAKRALEKTVVRAPRYSDNASIRSRFVVLERRVAINQLVGPTAGDLFVLAGDVSRMRVVAPVAEAEIQKIRVGQSARVTLPGEDERIVHGTIAETRLTPISDRGAVYYPVLLDIANERLPSGWLLRPGLTATVDIEVRTHESAWKLPAAALHFRPDDATLSAEARQHRAQQPAGWETVWVPTQSGPWPVFVRTSGPGETGIQDSQFTEVLEWEAGSPLPGTGAGAKVIVGVTKPQKGGLFNPPQIKF